MFGYKKNHAAYAVLQLLNSTFLIPLEKQFEFEKNRFFTFMDLYGPLDIEGPSIYLDVGKGHP